VKILLGIFVIVVIVVIALFLYVTNGMQKALDDEMPDPSRNSKPPRLPR